MEPSLISHSFSNGWSVFKSNWGILVGAIVLTVVISTLFFSLTTPFEEGSMEAFLINIVGTLVGMFLSLGIIKINLEVLNGRRATIGMLFSQIGRLWQYVVACILYTIMVMVGTVLLIIPGIFLAVKFYLYDIVIVDRQSLGPIAALKQASTIAKGNWWGLFGLLILMVLLNVLGALALGIGLLLTVPLTMMVLVSAYQYLSTAGQDMSSNEGHIGQDPQDLSPDQGGISHGPMQQ